jgi:hypothetical protein
MLRQLSCPITVLDEIARQVGLMIASAAAPLSRPAYGRRQRQRGTGVAAASVLAGLGGVTMSQWSEDQDGRMAVRRPKRNFRFSGAFLQKVHSPTLAKKRIL